MGKESNGNELETTENSERGTRPTTGNTERGIESTGCSDRSTNTAARASSRARGSGGGNSRGGEDESYKQEVPRLADVTQIDVKAPPKKKTSRKAAPKKQEDVVEYQKLSVILMTISSVVASRPNMELWRLSQEECDSIAKPIASMISKSENAALLTEHADAIALVSAAVTILLPRIIMTITMREEVKKQNVTGNSANIKYQERTIRKSNPEINQKDANHGTSDDATLSYIGAPLSC